MALRDVRSLAAHDDERHAARARSRRRSPPRAATLDDAPRSRHPAEAVQRRQLLRSPRGARRRLRRRSPPALAGLTRVDRRIASVARRRSHRQRFSTASRPSSADWLAPALEVAMGLETAHPDALERLNKRMTRRRVRGARRDALAALGVALRVFLLVSPAVRAARRAGRLAAALDRRRVRRRRVGDLADPDAHRQRRDSRRSPATGAFRRRRLADLERSLGARADARRRQRRAHLRRPLGSRTLRRPVRTASTPAAARLHAMNLEQRVLPPLACAAVPGTADAA